MYIKFYIYINIYVYKLLQACIHYTHIQTHTFMYKHIICI